MKLKACSTNPHSCSTCSFVHLGVRFDALACSFMHLHAVSCTCNYFSAAEKSGKKKKKVCELLFKSSKYDGDFLDGPVVTTLCFHYRGAWVQFP